MSARVAVLIALLLLAGLAAGRSRAAGTTAADSPGAANPAAGSTTIAAPDAAIMTAGERSAATNQALMAIQDQLQRSPDAALATLDALDARLPATVATDQLNRQRLRCLIGAQLQDVAMVAGSARWLREHGHALAPVDAGICETELAVQQGARQRAFVLARQTFEAALKLPEASRQQDWLLHFQAGMSLAHIATRLGEFETALQGYQYAQRIADTQQDVESQIVVWAQLATLYADMKRFDDALAASDRGIALAAATGNPYLQIGQQLTRYYLYAVNGAPDKAAMQVALETADQLARETGDAQIQLDTQISYGDFYFKTGQYARAIAVADAAVALATRLQSRASLATALANRGFARIRSGDAAGKADIEAGIRMLDDMGSKPEVANLLLESVDVLDAAGDAKGALAALRRYKTISDELFQTDREKRVFELREMFDAEKREREIAELNRQNAESAAALTHQDMQRRIGWLMALVAVLIVAVLALLYRRVRSANAALSEKNSQLDYQSTHDALTGLFNRRYFLEYSQQLDLSENQDSGHTRAVFLIDLDHFKRVNDRYGHAGGDEVLREVARRMQAAMRDRDRVVRWGGEEFLVYLPGVQIRMLDTVAERLMHAVGERPVLFDDQSIPVTLSIGYSVLPVRTVNDVLSWDRLLHIVDMALYLAKAFGRNRAIGIARYLSEESRALALVERDLPAALRAGFIELHTTPGPMPAACSATDRSETHCTETDIPATDTSATAASATAPPAADDANTAPA